MPRNSSRLNVVTPRELDVPALRQRTRARGRSQPASCRSAARARDPAWRGSHRRRGARARGRQRRRRDTRAIVAVTVSAHHVSFVDRDNALRPRLPGARAPLRRPPARGRAAPCMLPGAATGSRRSSSSRSHGTARKMPPERMNVNGLAHEPEPSRDGQPDASSSFAAPRRMPIAAAVAFAERRLDALRRARRSRTAAGCCNRPRGADPAPAAMPKCFSSSGVSAVFGPALIGFAQHRAQRGPADPVAAALVAEHVAPAAGAGGFVRPRCGRMRSTRCRR